MLAGEHHIEDLVFWDKEDRADNVHDKGIIYDLYCRTDSGEFIIVEMQNRWHSHFLDRTLYYVCRAVSRQIENPLPKHIPIPENRDENGMLVKEEFVPYGKHYQLFTVYGVFLMNFKEAGLEEKFRTDTVVSDKDSGAAATIVQFLSVPFVGLFTNDGAVQILGGQYLRSYAWDCVFAGVHFCLSGYFYAYGLSIVSFIHNSISIVCARIPLSYYAATHFPDTLFPMGCASPAGSIVSIVICVGVFVWMNKHTEKYMERT